MSYFDVFTLMILAIGALLGAWGGFTQNVLKIFSFIAALIIAIRYDDALLPLLKPYVHVSLGLLKLCSGVLTALLTVMIGFLLTSIVDHLIKATPLASLDRILGFLFGGMLALLTILGITALARWLLDPALFQQLTSHSRFMPWIIVLQQHFATWWSVTGKPAFK